MWHLRTLPHFGSCSSSVLAAHSLSFLTCFLDVGKVSCNRSRFTEPTLVLRKDAKGIGVANDEVGDYAAGAVVTLQDREPQLWVPGRRRVRHHSFGLFFLFVLPHPTWSFWKLRTPPSLRPRLASPQTSCQPSAPCIPGVLYCPYLVEVSIPE